jgi:hypothetical protein
VPDFLKREKIVTRTSQEYGDLEDNGKFHFLGDSTARYYASLDDDITYPPDYIRRLIETLEKIGPEAAVGVHGSNLPSHVRSITDSRHVWHFRQFSRFITPVDILGTGTTLFDQERWALQSKEFLDVGMSDVWFALAAARRGYPMLVIDRKSLWLDNSSIETGGNNTLFDRARLNQSRQTTLLQDNNLGGSMEKVLRTISNRPELLKRFSISYALKLLTISYDLSWKLPSQDFTQFFVRQLKSEITQGARPEKFTSEYIFLIQRLLRRRFSTRHKALLKEWLSSTPAVRHPQVTPGMLMDCSPSESLEIEKELSTEVNSKVLRTLSTLRGKLLKLLHLFFS